jgi:hypothetical protein
MYSAIEMLVRGILPTVRCCGTRWMDEATNCVNAVDELEMAREGCADKYEYHSISTSLRNLAHRLIKEQHRAIVSMPHSDFNPGVPTYQMLDWAKSVEVYFQDKGGIQ